MSGERDSTGCPGNGKAGLLALTKSQHKEPLFHCSRVGGCFCFDHRLPTKKFLQNCVGSVLFALSILLLGVGIAGCRSTSLDDRVLPDGYTDRETDQLNEFAKERGLDLYSKIGSICAGSTNALAEVFKFSLSFTNFDDNARSYGQFLCGILGTLVNMGFGRDERYAALVAAQDSDVKQRVRDFLYYSLVHESTNGRTRADNEIREEFPDLFPPNYRFGHDNPLFER